MSETGPWVDHGTVSSIWSRDQFFFSDLDLENFSSRGSPVRARLILGTHSDADRHAMATMAMASYNEGYRLVQYGTVAIVLRHRT